MSTPPGAGDSSPAPGGVVVRDARPADAAAVEALTLAAYSEYERIMEPGAWRGLDGAVRAALASGVPAERIVAERGGRVIGSVMLFPPRADAYSGLAARATWPELRLLAVAREARGLGVGRLLVDECVRRARLAGAREIGLHTSASMRAARALYEAMGFVRAPELDFRPDGAELVEAFRLPLDPRPRG